MFEEDDDMINLREPPAQKKANSESKHEKPPILSRAPKTRLEIGLAESADQIEQRQ